MDVSLGNAHPAPGISAEQISKQQDLRRFADSFTNPVGSVKSLVRRVSHGAARWLANRRVWSPRVTATAVGYQTRLTGQLDAVRSEMLARTGLDIAIGAATSRSVARTASRLPGVAGVVVVAAGQERAFLAPLLLRRLDGVSEAELRILGASGMVTIGELQRVPKAALQAEFGQAEGLRLWRAARGLDTEPVTERHGSDAGARTAGAEARLLNGSLSALRRSSLFAAWGEPRARLLRRVRLFAGAAR